MKALAGICTILPGAAFACALPPSVILTLPTGHYIAGAALTVGLTALLGAAAHRLPAMQPRVLQDRRILIPVSVTSYLCFLGFLALVAMGFLGPRDPMHNLMTLVFWTGIWIALPLGSMCKISSMGNRSSFAEVIGFQGDRTLLMPLSAPTGSRIDVRSVSRVGQSDVGTNARRIRAYLDQVRGA